MASPLYEFSCELSDFLPLQKFFDTRHKYGCAFLCFPCDCDGLVQSHHTPNTFSPGSFDECDSDLQPSGKQGNRVFHGFLHALQSMPASS